MKKLMMILVMLLIAATSYNQTSRKPTNSKEPATKPAAQPAQTSSSRSSANSPQDRSTTTRRTEQSAAPQSTISKQPTTSRPESRAVTPGDSHSQRAENVNTNRRSDNITTNRTSRRSTDVNTNRSANRPAPSGHASRNDRPRVEYTSPRVYRDRHEVRHHYSSPPRDINYRRVHNPYRRPVHFDVYWTPVMHRHYIEMYPMVPHWRYYNGYHIETISAYDANFYQGDVVTVYGRVTDVYYSPATDEYFMYFGPYYPYQDFTVIVPGYIARRYGHRPERSFIDNYLAVTGLITSYNGEPEIYVKRDFQLHLY